MFSLRNPFALVFDLSSLYMFAIKSSYWVSNRRFLFYNYILNFKASSLAKAYLSLFFEKLFSSALNFLFLSSIGDLLPYRFSFLALFPLPSALSSSSATVF